MQPGSGSGIKTRGKRQYSIIIIIYYYYVLLNKWWCAESLEYFILFPFTSRSGFLPEVSASEKRGTALLGIWVRDGEKKW